ncbi:uncharacterized protein LOC107994562 isoform X2 [Apis cerana]|uniref:uncharacterized protein LOC107994562 isoform X2 n=1 Tax=Apis cerana TaxID=7461 RepID=UPI002B236DBB|nr:uncharacterized protein LOC107994562 isoform X2 [Apis cerana]
MRGLWPVMLILARILEPLLGDDGCHRNDTDHAIPCQRSRELLLSRRRRLAFPQGSTFVVTASILQPIPVKLPSNWNMVFEFDVIWPIPTTEDYKKKYKNKYKYKRRQWMVKRRHRRELYATFEMALNSQNLPGRECTLRTICEARTLLSPPGDSFVEDALRLILSNVDNVRRVDSYDVAYRTETPCEVAYPCPVSLLKLLLSHLYHSNDLG